MTIHYPKFSSFLLFLFLCFFQKVDGQNIYFKHFTTQEGLAHDVVNGMTQDPNGYLWLATNDGLSRFNGTDFYNFYTQNGLLENAVTDVAYAQHQIILSFKNLSKNASKNQKQTYQKGHFQSIEDNIKLLENTSELGKRYTWDTVRNRFFWKKNNYQRIDLLKELNITSQVTDALIDHENHLWLATQGDGIYWINHSPFTNYGRADGLQNTYVNDISEDANGDIWAGTNDGFFKLVGNRWLRRSEAMEVWKFRKSAKKELFASTNEGIYRIEVIPQNCIPDEKTATSFILDEFGSINLLRNGYFWTYAACEVQPTKWISQLKNLQSGYSLFEDDQERLWVGTDRGAFVYQNLQSIQFSRKNGLPSDIVNDILQDSEKNIWLATEKGLVQIQNDTIQRIYTVQQGLLTNQCRRLCLDPRGGIWIATPRGMHFLFQDKIIPYDEQTGMSSSDVNALFIDSKNQLWIATSNGIAKNPMTELPTLGNPPNVKVSNIWLNDTITFDADLSKLPYNTYIKIGFDAITFSNTNQIAFEYRLRENDAWQPTQDRFLNLTSLREGKYTFQVRAKKINSEWSDIESLSFEIKPPFWRALWFLIVVILVVIGISIVIIYYIRRQEAQKTAFNKQLAELELNAIQAQLNPHFIFNALNAIQDFVVKNNANEANKYLSKFSKLMRLFLESAKSKYITLADEIKLLQLYVTLEKICYDEKFDYIFEMDEQLDDEIEIPSMFVQPFVENAIRHGLFHKATKGFLTISFFEKGEYIFCKITDNGIGRAKAQDIAASKRTHHKSRGMEIIEERKAVFNELQHDAVHFQITDLKDKNGNPKGTEVLIRFEVDG